MFDESEPTDVRRILILLFFLLFYFISLADNRLRNGPLTHINWITIWLSFFFGLLFTILFRFLNRNSKTPDQRSDAGLPLGGWIIVLGITLVLRLVLQAYIFWNENYFMKSTWIQLERAGGLTLQSLFIFEMFLSLFSMTGTVALLYWFFGRRDIFPSMFIYYVVIFLLAQFILLIMYNSISVPVDLTSVRHDNLKQFIRMVIYSAVWISFVLKSEKVKQTFIYPPG